jgi:hypothetical protein
VLTRPRRFWVDTRFSKLGVLTRPRRLFVDTRFTKLGVLTSPRRFWVLTRPRRLFVLTRFTKLAVLTRPTRFAVDTYPAEPSPITVEKRGPPTVAPLMDETVRLEPLKRPVIIEEKLPVCATVIVEKVLVPL